jgi:tellurite methyltransferase
MIDNLNGIDIYLLDLLLKGFIHGNQEILDAGCGTGRNIKYFLSQNMHVTGVDSDEQCILQLKNQYPEKSSRFIHSSIEEFGNGKSYDLIICNAVLHFAKGHKDFDIQFEKLISLLNPNGLIFIRMTSNIGIDMSGMESVNGTYCLKDGTIRYLITLEKTQALMGKFHLKKLAPLKSTVVEGVRSMATLVFTRS